jgi:uncharacterized lipoprotein YddW (UPF0748 family)
MRYFLLALSFTFAGFTSGADYYHPSQEKVPTVTREFRGAWAAVIYNIDWPSSSGLSAATQQAEMRGILDRMSSLNMNALIFQVRPQCDAVYASSAEPWSPWLSGTMGQSPGYDPLDFTIREAHRRGIEVHAWFNPFRALSNVKSSVSSSHITKVARQLTKPYGTCVWCDPAQPEARTRAMNSILDVLKRYDVDGIHIDDYFYPYPQNGERFNDGRSNESRRAVVDSFVQNMYSQIKRSKPWARVGISPFGIWKPGVPSSTTAGLNAYEDLGCDARKWLANGWCDYMAPQLYWRISGPQSYTALLGWWRGQGERPVWPGIASARIKSSEDPSRGASEIVNQIQYSRTIGKNYVGHMLWSVKSIMQNRDNLCGSLKTTYAYPALVPPMPWINRTPPSTPRASGTASGNNTVITWQKTDNNTAKIAVQSRIGNTWTTIKIIGVSNAGATIPLADAIAISAVDRYGNTSTPNILRK